MVIACRFVIFTVTLGAGFFEKCRISPFSVLGHCFDVVSLGGDAAPRGRQY